ncbi:ribosomal protein S16 domain-containing protein [Glomus cerebriforme]|uniref:Ribosomal protein S16 domain-containing protein n=1 Tax=Glomus cerebriforme TaxID=658196 RepID=A0A397S5H7_9GLOM|nr:ribosomal protein S16 domain-containing protein [Glomus cerebriforme]
MVIRIRLARHGIKIRNRPFYNIVVANARTPRDGKHIEKVGLYDPIPNDQGIKNVELDTIVANARTPRDGKHIEKVGLYDPIPNDQGIKNVELDTSRIKYWISVGAQPSDTVARLLSKAGIIPTLPKGVNKPKNKPKFLVNPVNSINEKVEDILSEQNS